MIKPWPFLITFLLICQATFAQSFTLNRQLFFLDDRALEVSITTDIRKLRHEKNKPVWQSAEVVIRFADSIVINEQIALKPRGIFRRANCDLASLMLDFKNTTSPSLSPLKKLKLVGGCSSGTRDEILLLKEYIVYKIYNFISVMSFRVRLLHVTYNDSKRKIKSYTQYAFLIEDIKDLAERNNCIELTTKKVGTESCDRQQINLVSLFQYMIGNTDWSVPTNHNIKLLLSKTNLHANPFAIPYDFDFAGMVDAGYAVPNEELRIKSVRERVYRGFVRSLAELQVNIEIFREKKDQAMFYINNFVLLNANERKVIIKYLEEFYNLIDSKKRYKSAFIDNARKD